jgi:hypothetical protein
MRRQFDVNFIVHIAPFRMMLLPHSHISTSPEGGEGGRRTLSFSAARAQRDMNPQAAEKFLNLKERVSLSCEGERDQPEARRGARRVGVDGVLRRVVMVREVLEARVGRCGREEREERRSGMRWREEGAGAERSSRGVWI